jgi:hypothetical protein
VEIEGEGGGKLRRSARAWSDPPAFSNNSVRSFGELVQNLLHFRPPGRRVQENPVITYLGKNWQDGPMLGMLIELLGEHLPAEGQTISLKVGRDPRIVIERKDDQIAARLYSAQGSPQEYALVPEPRTGKLTAIDSALGRSYSYQALNEYHREAAGLVGNVLGVKGIGAIVQQRLNTGLPLETVIQAPLVRGRLLAEIVNVTLKNIELPSYLEQWIQVHRFIEKAYAHLDFETVQSYRRHLSDTADYQKALKEWNAQASSPKRSNPRRNVTEEPGAALIPKWENQEMPWPPLFSALAKPWASRLLARDPERLGQIVARTFHDHLEPLFRGIDSLERKNPPESLSDFLNQNPSSLDRDGLSLRKEFLNFFESFYEWKRILTEGRGRFQEAFLRSALQYQPGFGQDYSRLGEILSNLEPSTRATMCRPSLKSWSSSRTPRLPKHL